jgi:adenylate cyclase
MNTAFRLIFISLLTVASFFAAAQKHDTAFVNTLLQKSKSLFAKEPDKAIAIAQEAREISKELNYQKGEATALKNIGIVYYMQQNYVATLNNWMESLEIFKAAKDDNGIANLLNNIAAVYKDQGVDEKALSYALESLTYAEKLNDSLRLTSSLVTIASIHHNKKDPRSLGYLIKALKYSSKDGLGVLYGNIGEVNFDLGEAVEKRNHDSATMYFLQALNYYELSVKADQQSVSAAFSYNGIGKVNFKFDQMDAAIASHQKALSIASTLEDSWNAFKAYQGIANASFKSKNNAVAFENYNKALPLAEKVNNTDIADLYRDMAGAYQTVGDYKNALSYQQKLNEKQLEIYNADIKKKLGIIDIQSNLEKQQSELAIVTKQKQIEQQQKTGFAIGLGLLCIIAIILFRNFKAKVKINKVLDKQNAEIEGLLLNILPAEVAKELQVNGTSVPKQHDDVAVLFTDFKGFTNIADRMSPQDLVSQLSECFVAFDSIIDKYGLEKIKTIGDAYMCAGGIPSKGEKNTYRIVKAAIEIQQWVEQNNMKRVRNNLEPWDIRIGVHTGPLVAGVVGKKKYAYDIWGTTVNIASRMESNGEPGKVNISAAAYQLVKEDFECVYRGKITAKNIGDIDMYFVDKELDHSYRVIGNDANSDLFIADKSLN